MGDYAATDQYQCGRQVYLAVKLNSGGCWVVDWGKGYRSYSSILRSQTAPTLCPADPQAAGTRRRGWRFGGPSNVPSDSIVVKCLVH